MNTAVSEIYTSIQNNKVAKAFKLMTDHFPKLIDKITVLQNRFKSNENNNAIGVLNNDKYNIEKARILYGMTVLLGDTSSEDDSEQSNVLKQFFTEQISFFVEKIKEMRSMRVISGSASVLILGFFLWRTFRNFKELQEGNFLAILITVVILILIVIISLIVVIKLTENSLEMNNARIKFMRNLK